MSSHIESGLPEKNTVIQLRDLTQRFSAGNGKIHTSVWLPLRGEVKGLKIRAAVRNWAKFVPHILSGNHMVFPSSVSNVTEKLMMEHPTAWNTL